MKRQIMTLAVLGAAVSAGLTVTASGASASVDPGLYRLCPVAVNIPGTYVCRTLTMKQYIDEVRAIRAPGFGYGPLVSTPTGGYLPYQAFGKKDSGRVTFVRTPTGYDVSTTGTTTSAFNSTLRMTRLR
ncbi:hypothetical protein ACXVUM_00950 [Williamsia sp. SKLECPSW1]